MAVREFVTPEAEREKNRKRKERYRGVCEVCGGWTTGSEGRAKAPKRCWRHNSRGAEKQIGTGPLQQELLAMLADGPQRWLTIRERLDISGQHTSVLLNHAVKHRLVERIGYGLYRKAA